MATLTLKSAPKEPLSTGYKNLDATREKFRRKLRRIEKEQGLELSLCVLEETFNTENRWNPHLHWVWFIPFKMTTSQREAFQSIVIEAWIDSAALAGQERVSPEAQRFTKFTGQQGAKNVAYYVTKNGFYPSSCPQPDADGGFRGLAPFDILELAKTTGDMLWIRAYNEFEYCNRGRHRIKFFDRGPSSD